MSCIIYAIVESKENIFKECNSKRFFDVVKFACTKNIALNPIEYKIFIDKEFQYLEQDYPQNKYLRENEIGMSINNNYLGGQAEPFLEADFAAKDSFEGKRLKDLEEVLAYILDLSFVKRIRLYTMKTEEYDEDNFDKIHCPIQGFAEKYKDYFFFNLEDYTTEFIFEKE